MKKEIDQAVQAWLDEASAALLLFQENTLVGHNAYARKLLPGIEPGTSAQEILGQELQFDAFQDGVVLMSVERLDLRYDAKLSLWRGYQLVELIQPEENRAALALRSVAEGLMGPMTTVMALLPKLLPQLEDATEQKNMEWAAQVNRSLYAMNRAVNNIRFVAGENGIVPHLQHINLTQWMGELAEQMQTLFEMSDRVLTVDLPGKPLMCDADIKLLERGLMNVVSNAMKFTQSGGHVKVSMSKMGGRVRITVRDDGCGIPAYQMGNILQQNAHRAPLPDARQGIGLGLGMTRKILQLHGGSIMLESQEGKGTAVHLMLPASQDQGSMSLATTVQRPEYNGGFQKLLVELSDALPGKVYDTRGIDL